MSNSPLNNPFSPEEISCIEKVKASPENEKQSAFEKACHTIGNKTRIRALAISLGLSQPGFAGDLGNQDKNILNQSSDIQSISNIHRQAIESGKLPNIFPLDIVKVGGIKSPSDLEQIVIGGSNLPKKSWQELSKGSDNFFVLLDLLFDSSDIDTWLKTGKEKRTLTSEEKKEYIEELAKTKEKWRKKIPNWQAQIQKGELNEKVFDDFDKLFEEGKKSLIFPSRETFRRLLVASASIAYFQNFKGNEKLKKNLVSTTATQTGEYTLLTNPKFSGTKVEFGNEIYSVKYILPDPQTISSNPNLAGLENISNETIGYFKSSFEYNLKSALSSYNIKQNERRIAQNKKEISENNEYIKLSTETDILTKGILNLISEYMNTKDSKIYIEIQRKIDKLKGYLPIIEQKIQLGNEKEIWEREKRIILTITQKVNQLPKVKV